MDKIADKQGGGDLFGVYYMPFGWRGVALGKPGDEGGGYSSRGVDTVL